MRKTTMFAAGAATFIVLQASPALAGVCSDPWIDQAILELTNRTPFNSECDISQYNGGKWSSYAELKKYVGIKLGYISPDPVKAPTAPGCADPWITQAIRELTRREPFPSECNIRLYNGGKWSSYPELKNYVAISLGYASAPKPAPAQIAPPPTPKANPLLAGQNLANFNGMTFANPNTKKAFVDGNTNNRKAFVDRLVTGTERIGNQDYFRVGDKWFLQTAREFGTHIGIEVPGMVVLDGSKFTQAKMENGKPYVWTGSKWVQLVGNDGASLIGNDTAGMVAAGGMNLVGNDGASLTAKLVGNDGASLISNFSNGFLSNKGAGFISTNGGTFISTNGATMVAAGGGNMVAAGGGNMVAAGGGNLIATPAGLVAPGVGNLAGRGGTAVPTNAGNILSNANGAAVAKPVGSYRAYSAATQRNQPANQVTIAPDKAAAWRFDPKTNQQQFQYGGKWYVVSAGSNGVITGALVAN